MAVSVTCLHQKGALTASAVRNANVQNKAKQNDVIKCKCITRMFYNFSGEAPRNAAGCKTKAWMGRQY